jgi:restriction system protein
LARKRESAFDALITVAAILPWQVALVLAMISYVALHHFAGLPPIPIALGSTGQVSQTVGDSMTRQMVIAACTFLQYLVPAGFVIGALVSVMRRRRQAKIHDVVVSGLGRGALESIPWNEFEDLTAEVFRRKGYRVVERGGSGPDGGVDVELRLGADKYLVQCKQWKTTKVGVATVRELYGVMAAEGAVGGFVVTSGAFTHDARTFAEGRSIKLVPSNLMTKLVRETASKSAGGDGPAPAKYQPIALEPACPKCGSKMVQRKAKRGTLAGAAFWGCSTFPKCHGVAMYELHYAAQYT